MFEGGVNDLGGMLMEEIILWMVGFEYGLVKIVVELVVIVEGIGCLVC